LLISSWSVSKHGHHRQFFFMVISKKSKNCLWRPCLLTDWDEMCNLYRGPSIDASYQVFVHLAKRFQRRRFFRNRPIRNKNCLWRPCLNLKIICQFHAHPVHQNSVDIFGPRYVGDDFFRFETSLVQSKNNYEHVFLTGKLILRYNRVYRD
jgi:hypothetical protein